LSELLCKTGVSREPLIEIRAFGNPAVGFGHIRRSLSLFHHLKSLFVCRIRIETSDGVTIDGCMDGRNADLLIFDSPIAIDEQIFYAKNQRTKTLALDYFGKAAPDLTISVFEHFTTDIPGRRISGLEFIIIRQDILELKASQQPSSEHTLVAMGGGDVLGVGPQVANTLSDYEAKVILVEGPFAKTSGVEPCCKPNISLVRNPPNLSDIMHRSFYGVTNAGGCLFEMMFLGRACFVVPQTDFENRIARLMSEKAAVLGVGLESIRRVSSAEVRAIGETARNIVDGNGLNRIAKHVEDLI
jgi:spore coat polysaccharide biosynthesis predicted glycosyltransferase SpsG